MGLKQPQDTPPPVLGQLMLEHDLKGMTRGGARTPYAHDGRVQ